MAREYNKPWLCIVSLSVEVPRGRTLRNIYRYITIIYHKITSAYLLIKQKMANSIKTKYNRNDIKSWIQFGIQNGYINQFKKDQILKWVELLLKHEIVNKEFFSKNEYRIR